MLKVAIAGAGFSGAVIARILAEAGYDVDVFDPRPHVAGNCHTERDQQSGVLVHKYGPHIFHTSNEEVWEFIKRFGEFKTFRHRVKATSGGSVYSLPVNLHTINQLFRKTLSPGEAQAFIKSIAEKGDEPVSFEDQALRFVGRDMYKTFFYGYTLKQWGMEPSLLPASILKRLPVRFDYNDEYFNHKYQVMPAHGYTAIVESILNSPKIKLHLGKAVSKNDVNGYDHFFYTGPLDGYFNYSLGRLGYRTLDFEAFRHDGDFQGCSVMNYCDSDVPFTRIAEHKHFAPWETHAQSICFREFSRLAGPGDTPYYPIRLVAEQALLKSYIDLAQKETGVTFVGRLATYRYLDMDVTIGEALKSAQQFLDAQKNASKMPAFTVDPSTHG
jgi:UDP-galactopyranose mutase